MANYRILLLFAAIAVISVLYYQQQVGMAGERGLSLLPGQVSSATSQFRPLLSDSNSTYGQPYGGNWNTTAKLVGDPLYIANYSFLLGLAHGTYGSAPEFNGSATSEASFGVLGQIGSGAPLSAAAYTVSGSGWNLLSYSELIPLYFITAVGIVNPIGISMPSVGFRATSLQPANYSLGYGDPLARYQTLDALYSLGTPVLNNTSVAFSPGSARGRDSLVPFRATDAYSLYELEMTDLYITQQAQALGSLFSCGVFSANRTAPGGAGLYGTALAWSPGPFSGLSTGFAVTGLTGGEPRLSSMTADWMALATSVEPRWLDSAASGTPVCRDGTPNDRFFYLISYGQYQGDTVQQLIYNKSLGPGFAFIGYSDGSLLVDVDNVNLSRAGGARLAVDNSTLPYSRHYNMFLAEDNLSQGYHSVSFTLGNRTLTSTLYVEPFIPMMALLTPSTLSITIYNTTYGSLDVTDFSASGSNGDLYTYPNFTMTRTTTVSLPTNATCQMGQHSVYTIDFNTQYGAERLVSSVTCD